MIIFYSITAWVCARCFWSKQREMHVLINRRAESRSWWQCPRVCGMTMGTTHQCSHLVDVTHGALASLSLTLPFFSLPTQLSPGSITFLNGSAPGVPCCLDSMPSFQLLAFEITSISLCRSFFSNKNLWNLIYPRTHPWQIACQVRSFFLFFLM